MRTIQDLSMGTIFLYPLRVIKFKTLRRMKEFVFVFNGLERLKFKPCLKRFLRQILRQLKLKHFNWLCKIGLKS